MKNLINEAIAQLRASNGATRVVMAAGAVMILAMGMYSVWRGRNPHMTFFLGGLDNSQFSDATNALSSAGIRFQPSTGGAPYNIFVDEDKFYEANIAVAQNSALRLGPRGIDPASGNGAFDASVERVQKAAKRNWQEIEQLLEAMDWIRAAKVIAHSSNLAIMGRNNQPTVSVQLRTNLLTPGPNQTQGAAKLVANAFSTDPKNVSIVDQHGEILFDGTQDSSLDKILEFERNADRSLTVRAQELIDRAYGPGYGVVKIRSEWNYVTTESMNESLDPKKAILSESISDSSTPGALASGGPAGVQENLTIAQNPGANADPATRSEVDRQFLYGTKTTHSIQSEPQLVRLTGSLILDASLEGELEKASKLVRNAVGINEERGDQFVEHAWTLHGIERDEEGNPIPPQAPAPLEAPNRILELTLRHGIEGLAALFFLIVLLRSLKSGDKALQAASAKSRKASASRAASASRGLAKPTEEEEQDEEIEIDPEVLARRQIEQLIDTDPERVSALLSRWAMGDNYYSESGA